MGDLVENNVSDIICRALTIHYLFSITKCGYESIAQLQQPPIQLCM